MKVTKLITVATFEELLEDALMEMESYLLLEEEGTIKYDVLNTIYTTFKEETENALTHIKMHGINQNALEKSYHNAEEIINDFNEATLTDGEDLIMNFIMSNVLNHKNFKKVYFAVQSAINTGIHDMNDLMIITNKYMNDLQDYEQNFAICYVAEDIGFDMDNLENNELFD